MSAATAEAALIVTQPGVYEDIPNDAYHADPVPDGSLSSSGAKRLLPPSTPAHFKWHRDNPQPFKAAFNFGSAAHAEVLGVGEPIEVIDAKDYRTKAAQQARDAAVEAGRLPLLPEEAERVKAMAKALREHPTAGALFADGSGVAEASMFAPDPKTGVMLRARTDWLPYASDTGLLILPDYKTTQRADVESLRRTVHNFRYAFQGDWYSRVVKLLDLASDVAFVLVFQEVDAPYLVHVVQPDPESMAAAAADVRHAIDTYAACAEANEWPGYSDGITQLPLPRWA